MADADGLARPFVRGETLDLFLDIFIESELENLFEEEVDNMRREVIRDVR